MPDVPTELLVPVGMMKAATWFFENSLDTFLAMHAETLVKTNATWTRLTGWSSGDTDRRPLFGIIRPDDQAGVRAAINGLGAATPSAARADVR